MLGYCSLMRSRCQNDRRRWRGNPTTRNGCISGSTTTTRPKIRDGQKRQGDIKS